MREKAAAASAELQSGGRVLLADDNADMREYIRRLLGGRCDVRTVADGRAALRDIREHRPDLVLADIMMPIMDGFEFLRVLRSREDGRAVPVVVVTAKELTVEERNLLRACVENVVQKGAIGNDELLDEIRTKVAAASHT